MSSDCISLQPEYRKAVDVLCLHLPRLRPIPAPDPLPSSISEQGSIFMFEGIIAPSRIPADDPSWRWNQSKSKRTVHLAGDGADRDSAGKVEVMKLIPRRRASHVSTGRMSAPSLKLWLFYYFPCVTSTFSIFWCEKGVDPASLEPEPSAGGSPTFIGHSAESSPRVHDSPSDDIDRSSFFSVVLS